MPWPSRNSCRASPAAIERLERSPVTLPDSSLLSGHRVVRLLGAVLGAGQYSAVPLFMDRVARGDLQGADEIFPLASVPELLVGTEGAFYSVLCCDEGGQPAQALPPQGAGWPDAVRRLVAEHGNAPTAQVCERWTAGQTLPPRPVEPVRSAVPALVTVGSFDAATPLSNAGSLQRDLPRSRLVVFPGRGHGLLESDPCMLQIAADYIERPHAAPDTACVPDARSLDLGFLMP